METLSYKIIRDYVIEYSIVFKNHVKGEYIKQYKICDIFNIMYIWVRIDMYAKMLTEIIYGDNDNFVSLHSLVLHPYVSHITLLCQEKSPIQLLKKKMSMSQEMR